jgi:ankyrin repeat protein
MPSTRHPAAGRKGVDNKTQKLIEGGKKRKVSGRPDVTSSDGVNGDGMAIAGEGTMKGQTGIEQSLPAEGMNAFSSDDATVSTSKGGGGASSSKPEIRISFGPSRPPSKKSGGVVPTSIGLTTTTKMGCGRDANSASSFAASLGELDLKSLKERTAAAIASSASGSGAGGFSGKIGLPCSEAEMKALMSMFVDIMGMSIKSGGGGEGDSSTTAGGDKKSGSGFNNGPFFSFPTISSDGFAATGSFDTSSGASIPITSEEMASMFSDGAAWEALRRTYAGQMTGSDPPSDYGYTYDHEDLFDHDDDDDYEDSLDGEQNRELTFEEVEFLLQRRKQQADATHFSKQLSSSDWESLEHGTAGEYQIHVEDRDRETAKKREKKQKKKAKQKEEAARKAAEEARKELEKFTVSWRSRVVSACQSNESQKLESLLRESPLRKLSQEDHVNHNLGPQSSFQTHLELLLPTTIPKNRQHVERGVESRMLLANFVLEMDLPLAFKPMRSGRSALHTACFFGDVQFVKLLFEEVQKYNPTKDRVDLPPNYIDITCEESGWSPLHYAALSGSFEVLEILLENGPDLRKMTDTTHTWRKSNGLGITARELVEFVMSGKQDKEIETHGVALLDVTNSFLGQMQERRLFLRNLERARQRLAAIEKNGYTPPSTSDSTADWEKSHNDCTSKLTLDASSAEKKKRQKKKKKKKNNKEVQNDNQMTENMPDDDESRTSPVLVPEPVEEIDPLFAALQGMGFGDTQINAAVKACGGINLATADDLVTWILTQETDYDSHINEPAATYPSQVERKNEVRWEKLSKDADSNITDLQFEKEQKEQQTKELQEEAARRLAAKREQARRRNREWNTREQARQEREAKAKVAQKAIAGLQQSTTVVPLPNILHGAGLPKVSTMNRSYSIPMPRPSPVISAHSFGSEERTLQNNVTMLEMAVGTKLDESRPLQVPSKPGSHLGHVSANIEAAPASMANNPVAVSSQHQLRTGFVSFPQNNDDDRTVSSLGSNRGLSVSSKEFVPTSFTANSSAQIPPVLPPGFMNMHSTGSSLIIPPRSVTTVPEQSSSVLFLDDNRSQGEIRATARAFVPSSYNTPITPPIPPSREDDCGVPGSPLISDIRPMSQQLQGVGISIGPQSQHSNKSCVSSFLGAGFTSALDVVPSMTPVSEDSTTPGTSLAGIISSEKRSDDFPMSIALGGLGSTNLHDATHGSSLAGSDILGAISGVDSVRGNSIWGSGPSDGVPSVQSSFQASFFGGEEVMGRNAKSVKTNDEPMSLTWNAASNLTGAGEHRPGRSIW